MFSKQCDNTGDSNIVKEETDKHNLTFVSKMNTTKLLNLRGPATLLIHFCGFKNYKAPPDFSHIELPEKRRLKFVDKVPTLPPSIRPPKMQKRLRYMRGVEEYHNYLLHEQFGIIALGGGRLKWSHFEMMRMAIVKKMDQSRMFAVWRVDAPWQPVTKLGHGQRLGGGKGAIDHYVTPVKAGRVILEVGGKCDFREVEKMLSTIADKLPFKAMAVSNHTLKEMKEKEKWEEENNQNLYTMKYLIQNNMGGCHRHITPWDFKYFCKYV